MPPDSQSQVSDLGHRLAHPDPDIASNLTCISRHPIGGVSQRMLFHWRLFQRRLFYGRLFYRNIYYRGLIYKRLFIGGLFHKGFDREHCPRGPL